MMVALIERDHGQQLAASVGDWFLHTHIREGFGPQRMDLRHRLGVAGEKLLFVLRTIKRSIETPLARAALALEAGISLHQLERLFQHHIGHGIHRHYRWLRLERARWGTIFCYCTAPEFWASPPRIVEGLDVSDSRLGKVSRRYNAAPSQELLVVRQNHKTGERSLDLIQWGLIPHWCTDSKPAISSTVPIS
jgi:SOS response associated peptidase (SRAP)